MQAMPFFDTTNPSRELIRTMRRSVNDVREEGVMPESVVWQVFVELRKRGNPDATPLFINTLKQLHSRRALGAVSLPLSDGMPDEHRMVEDGFLGDLWKAYKKCLSSNRTGPAFQLLKDIEERINA